MLTPQDIWLFKEGAHFNLQEKLGAHLQFGKGAHFAVWAPNANYVSVIGDFNHWNKEANVLSLRDDGSGIWEGDVDNVKKGNKYKYYLMSHQGKYCRDKGDPCAFFWEQPFGNSSIVWDLEYEWQDKIWLAQRQKLNDSSVPISIYEIHHPSWRRVQEKDKWRFLTYRELAKELPIYVKEMGFTHVEFLPIMEHPLYSSWGYQTTGYFAPSSRYGTPQDFMYLIDQLHQEGIGVILDWTAAHFPTDLHGLAYYDGTHLYEYESHKKRQHLDWNTFIFDYGKPQVRSFLISNALFWFEKYHIDCLRVDAVASMLYLDYSRQSGEWEPNIFGGRENLEAIDFLQRFNREVYAKYPYSQTIAEESTDWPLVSRPTYVGGLGFGMKWNMGWMHDILNYMKVDPIFRKYDHHTLEFSIHYAFSENFILPLSHDEVVYGKKSMLEKMPGDEWQKFANLRLLYGYMYGHPGKKLLFMGDEFAQKAEWNHDKSLDWHLLKLPYHQQVQQWIKDLNICYRNQKALHTTDFQYEGFDWVDAHNWEESVICFIRKAQTLEERLLLIFNFTPVIRHNYRMGVPQKGFWKELLNSDAKEYGGSGQGNFGGVWSESVPCHGRQESILLTLPPLSALFFKLF